MPNICISDKYSGNLLADGCFAYHNNYFQSSGHKHSEFKVKVSVVDYNSFFFSLLGLFKVSLKFVLHQKAVNSVMRAECMRSGVVNAPSNTYSSTLQIKLHTAVIPMRECISC